MRSAHPFSIGGADVAVGAGSLQSRIAAAGLTHAARIAGIGRLRLDVESEPGIVFNAISAIVHIRLDRSGGGLPRSIWSDGGPGA